MAKIVGFLAATSAPLRFENDVVVADVAVDVSSVLAELLLVDARGGHLRVCNDVCSGADRCDAFLRGAFREDKVVRVVEIGGGVYAPLDDGELGLGPCAAVELRRYDLHAALLDLFRFHYLYAHSLTSLDSVSSGGDHPAS